MSDGRKNDQDKLRYDLIPPVMLKALASVLTYGAAKYAPNNWQKVEDGESRFTAALYRHLEAWRDGEVLDSESGLPHLHHAACNLAFLIHLENKKTCETLTK